MPSTKIIKQYQKIFNKPKKYIVDELKASEAKVFRTSLMFKYGQVISHYNDSDDHYAFSFVNKDVDVLIDFSYWTTNDYYHYDNETFEAKYLSNIIYPHSERSHYLKKNNRVYRNLCLGENFEICDNFLSKFQLVNLKIYLEDTIKEISSSGYWYPDDCFVESSNNKQYEFTCCKFCFYPTIKSRVCDNCKIMISRRFPKIDIKLVKSCNNHGIFYTNTKPCSRCEKKK